uniref:Uncharacterized protein n=1 Tax=Anguilla anguilla TaxID=7936 RepID=A0A0E9TXS0_ANGAN
MIPVFHLHCSGFNVKVVDVITLEEKHRVGGALALGTLHCSVQVGWNLRKHLLDVLGKALLPKSGCSS